MLVCNSQSDVVIPWSVTCVMHECTRQCVLLTAMIGGCASDVHNVTCESPGGRPAVQHINIPPSHSASQVIECLVWHF